ncbi:hypothetical protein F511_00732 [Dorcoceras hygrometricum]|nr:hypothetical protein F511_00732 [Dorcoceras hygrometricum]
MSGRVLQVHEPVCRDSDEEVAMNPRSGGEVSEAEKIRELSLQLVNAKNRAENFERQAAAYKRQLDMICEHIEEHNQSLSKKIQTALNNVKKVESRD